MDTARLRAFAQNARRQLMAAVTVKLDDALAARTPDYLATYAPQVAKLRMLAKDDRSGLVERAAYTWFNRLAALRFMDARGWHPFHVRVITPATGSETQPELLKLTRTGALPEELQVHTNSARLNDLLDSRIPSSDAQGDVYRHLVLAACRFYHDLLPDLFEKLDDETELLLPDDLLTEHSVAQGFRTEIADEDCGDDQRANVELLGWLYQFYISERKEEVMGRKSAVPMEDVPAVTQLFTPHWIVRYLVENSLGRLWLLNRPGSKLREHMPYYVEGEPETDFLKVSKPEDIRVLDPAVGSGHMLTYAFDLLTLIYEEEGYAPAEIPGLILRHNLHGLDICPRAAQLAELALVFKARDKFRRFFQPRQLVQPHVMELHAVRFGQEELRDYIRALELGDLFNPSLLNLLHQFEEANNFGSLIQPCLDERSIANARRAIEAKDLGGLLLLRQTHLKVLRALGQAEALTQRYHVVVANPPYMGVRQMNAAMKVFGSAMYPSSKSDLFSMFIERGLILTAEYGHLGLVTMHSWMFLSSFEQLRAHLISRTAIVSMAHLGAHGFDSIGGEVVQTTAFIVSNKASPERVGTYYRLTDANGEADKSALLIEAIADPYSPIRFGLATCEFSRLPGKIIAYWMTKRMRTICAEYPPLSSISQPRQGATTSDNSRFLRIWHEVSLTRINFDSRSLATAKQSLATWFPYNKGGYSRKWSGNCNYVINYRNDGEDIKAFHDILNKTSPGGRLKNQEYYFKPCVSWSKVAGGNFAVRYFPEGFIFDVAGSAVFFDDREASMYFCGLLNSDVIEMFLRSISPTINFEAEQLAVLPVPASYRSTDQILPIASLVCECVALARADWDNFETSWDFPDQPLLRPGLKGATLSASWRNWEAQSTAAIRRMQELETENNRLFISAYGLDGQLSPKVPDSQITIARAEARSDISAFLSYAVGCMMGRYSLDHPGLILANAGETLSDFLTKVGRRAQDQLTFAPDQDGIVPVLDREWFEDDIVARTRDFLRATFGEATLQENLRFIEESLGKDLRKYFLTDFYKDHLQTYKKRPIYWLLQSPRKGFRVLVYLHRYTRDTMNLVLNRYLREFQSKARNRVAHLTQQHTSSTSAREKTEARKESEKLTKIILECEEWERQTVLPLAQARIELNLDDGVKVNYLKLGEALAPIPGLAAEED